MKNILFKLLLVAILTFSIASCSDDEEAGPNGSVAGKWTLVSVTSTVFGQVVTEPVDDNEPGCPVNTVEFAPNSVGRYTDYSKVANVCTPEVDTATWTQNGATLTIDDGGTIETLTVQSVTNTNMVLRMSMVEAGMTIIIDQNFNRVQ